MRTQMILERGGETREHSLLKTLIADACRAAGWEVGVEVAGVGFRADVLASSSGQRHVFEVQLSGQTRSELAERQRRYREAGITCWWLTLAVPPDPASAEFAVFQLVAAEDGTFQIAHAGRCVDVETFVGDLLAGKARFANEIVGALRVHFVEMDCWRCCETSHVHWAEAKAPCGGCGLEEWVEEFDVLPEVQAWLAEHPEISEGQVKERYSRTAGGSYLSFGCPACDAIFGGWFVRERLIEARIYPEETVASFEIPRHPLARGAAPHWCWPGDGEQLCGTKPEIGISIP